MSRGVQVVILCGGKGTRMGENLTIPKPMVRIGDKPVLWHIMKIYSHYGFDDFILCLGYRGEKIREYFQGKKDWNITFAETGLDTNTGGRIKKIQRYIRGETFFATYGDGLSDINLIDLLKYHKRQKKVATLTVVKPPSPFGEVELGSNNLVADFKEKPILDHWINGGFFVFSKDIFEYVKETDVLEKDVFHQLVKGGNLVAYKHGGFWECMDTYKDNLQLNEMWRLNRAKWAVWQD